MKTLLIVATAIVGLVGPTEINPCGSGAAMAYASGYACCKVCKKGKACGDSCIARDKECHKGKGCACNG